ncbi:MAG: hypothetical protein BWZ10_02846 [candidate division BRC1 bacterium ADurb.BinA364]|nr:MAG: hypothetical protein BWZ10_02846 [candidate division BRC1 bacterium ADurb.BinA364]
MATSLVSEAKKARSASLKEMSASLLSTKQIAITRSPESIGEHIAERISCSATLSELLKRESAMASRLRTAAFSRRQRSTMVCEMAISPNRAACPRVIVSSGRNPVSASSRVSTAPRSQGSESKITSSMVR